MRPAVERPELPWSPRKRQIVAAARELLEAEGPDGVSMRRVAARLGIRAPSLYEHVADKRELELAMISEGFVELGDATQAAVRDPHDPVAAIGSAYRAFALAHPHLYRLITDRPLDRDGIAEGVERYSGEAIREAVDGDIMLARVLWAFTHGMIMLELNDRFPSYGEGPDEIWRRGLAQLREPGGR